MPHKRVLFAPSNFGDCMPCGIDGVVSCGYRLKLIASCAITTLSASLPAGHEKRVS